MLLLFNKTPSVRASGTVFQVLGQLTNSNGKLFDKSLRPAKEYFCDSIESGAWISAQYSSIGGQEVLRFSVNNSGVTSATVIHYQKPTGKGGPFYALVPFGTPSQKSHELPLSSHCGESHLVGKDPVLNSLMLINSSHMLDEFLAGNKLAEVEKAPETKYDKRLPYVTKYSIAARQALFRLQTLRECFHHRDHFWHVLLDMVAGCLFSMVLVQHCDPILLTETVDYYTITVLKSFVGWMMGYPAGLKINMGLTSFLGELILWLIYLWEEWTHTWKLVAWLVIWLVGGLGFVFGLTGALAALSDLLVLSTLHLRWFYYLESRIYAWHFSLIRSLYHLFRGKKYNVLHQRIDSCDYDVEQLILGTILFTILIFLFPTISVYYLVSVSAWLATVSLLSFVEIILYLVNHFPVYKVIRRIFFPSSLPFRIHLKLLSPLEGAVDDSRCFLHTVDFELKSVPLPLSDVFSSYALIFRHVSFSFKRANLFGSILTGRPIYPLPHFKLSSPDKPVD